MKQLPLIMATLVLAVGCGHVDLPELPQVLPPQTAPAEPVMRIVDFYTDWCGPCRRDAPLVDRLEAEGYPIERINAQHNSDKARKHKITAVPTYIVFLDGEEKYRTHRAASLADFLKRWSSERSLQTSASQVPDVSGEDADEENFQEGQTTETGPHGDGIGGDSAVETCPLWDGDSSRND